MILRIRCFSSAFRTFAACVVVVVLAVVLLCAAPVHASSDATFDFLQNFRAQIPRLADVWSSSDTAYCTWRYIKCNTTTGMASLELSELNLEGRYPQVNDLDGSEIYIESINMSFNLNFAASLRKDWKLLTHLRILDLSSTKTKDDLPDKWRELTNLEFLNLSNTDVDDNIPDDWAALTNLVVLDLRNTKVDDLDVEKIGQGMRSLEVLQLGETRVRDILEDLTSPAYFPRLRLLNVSYPVKTDTEELPSSLATWAAGLANLTYVGFAGYGFTGCVPTSYRSVPVLMQAARRANIALVMNTNKCFTYACMSPTELSEGTRAFLQLLKSSPFMDSAAALWSGDDYCSWQGVVCPSACGAGIELDLSSLPLAGSIPDVFAGLGDATVLIDAFTIRNNAGVVGAVPPSLATALSLARRVELSSLAITGTLSTTFGPSLRYVERLLITHTRLCGPLPKWDPTFLPPLRYADLSANRMGGALASNWADLPLKTVDLRKNGFCGCVPDSWLTKPLLMRSLDNAVVSAGTAAACGYINGCGSLNQLCDTTSSAPGPSDTIAFLKTLRGAFPKQLSSWGVSADYCDGSWRGVTCGWTAYGAHEVSLSLSSAQFDGTLPDLPAAIVGSRVLVTSINMSSNAGLTGSLPVSWGRLSYLRTLDLNGCLLRGDLPDAWEGMTRLETLYIAGSKLCRGLPSWKANNMPNLKYFDVSANTMFGGLSDSFGEFGPQLKYFNVTKNKFCGCVPSTWKAYHVLMVGVDNAASTPQCALASNACGRYAMRCESIEDTLLNFKDVNWNFLDLIKKNLGGKLDAAEGGKAVEIFSTWSDYDFCGYSNVLCSFHNGNNGFALDLERVGLKGTLPSISSDFKSAVAALTIDLAHNPWITGTLPPSWGEMTNLLYLDLTNTSVESSIPTAWQGMHNLFYLSLAHTLVCGSLPAWSANTLVSVLSLNFSHARLAGTLSDEWGTFGASELASLSLEGNAELCSCAPSAWLEGLVLPDALVSTFGTIPQITDTCASMCSAPPSCVNPEGEDSSDASPGPLVARTLHVFAAVLVAVVLAW